MASGVARGHAESQTESRPLSKEAVAAHCVMAAECWCQRQTNGEPSNTWQLTFGENGHSGRGLVSSYHHPTTPRLVTAAMTVVITNLQVVMVGAAGIEPATLGLEIRCSIRLSYAPV